MELVIYAPTEDQFIKEISFNAEEIKTELAQRLEKYNGLVYSEENIKEAKADRATLNKFKDAIEGKRKEMKKACLAPYESFETKIKEITAMIDKPILAIDTQVKNYEQAKKDEKLEGIKTFYADRVGDLAELVPFDRVFNQKWLNATYKASEIEKEILELFARVESDLQVIGELQTEYEPQLKDFYLKNYDLTATLQEKKRLEEQAAKLAEYNRQQEDKRQQAAKQASENKQQTEPAREPKTVVIDGTTGFEGLKPGDRVVFGGEPETPKPQEFFMDFRVWGTRDQLLNLKEFLVSNGYRYGKVPTESEERKAV